MAGAPGTQAEALGHAGAQALDEHVGGVRQPAHTLDALVGLEVGGDAGAGAVEAGEADLGVPWAGGRSIRTTSAPSSARSIAAYGAGPMPASSTTVRPASGPRRWVMGKTSAKEIVEDSSKRV